MAAPWKAYRSTKLSCNFAANSRVSNAHSVHRAHSDFPHPVCCALSHLSIFRARLAHALAGHQNTKAACMRAQPSAAQRSAA